eukprot:2326524-Prymnesium_polylepis.1
MARRTVQGGCDGKQISSLDAQQEMEREGMVRKRYLWFLWEVLSAATAPWQRTVPRLRGASAAAASPCGGLHFAKGRRACVRLADTVLDTVGHEERLVLQRPGCRLARHCK